MGLDDLERQEDGASAVEYSLIVTAIAAVIVFVVFAVGGFTEELYGDTCGAMSQASAYSGVTDCP